VGQECEYMHRGSLRRRGQTGSDIDLAVLFQKRPEPIDLLEARADLERLAGCPVDVIDRRSAGPIVAFQALKTGRLIADADLQALAAAVAARFGV